MYFSARAFALVGLSSTALARALLTLRKSRIYRPLALGESAFQPEPLPPIGRNVELPYESFFGVINDLKRQGVARVALINEDIR